MRLCVLYHTYRQTMKLNYLHLASKPETSNSTHFTRSSLLTPSAKNVRFNHLYTCSVRRYMKDWWPGMRTYRFVENSLEEAMKEKQSLAYQWSSFVNVVPTPGTQMINGRIACRTLMKKSISQGSGLCSMLLRARWRITCLDPRHRTSTHTTVLVL